MAEKHLGILQEDKFLVFDAYCTLQFLQFANFGYASYISETTASALYEGGGLLGIVVCCWPGKFPMNAGVIKIKFRKIL